MMLRFPDLPGLKNLLETEPSFGLAIKTMSESLGLNADAILSVMSLESGLRPGATNPISKATGLIQFMPSTARMLGTDVDLLRTMGAVRQLEYVRKFFEPLKRRIKEPGDYYMAVFMPAYIGRPRDTILGVKGSTDFLPGTNLSLGKVYDQNSGLDSAKSGMITVDDIMSKVERRLAGARIKPALEVAEVPLAGSPSSLLPDSSSGEQSTSLPEPGFLRGQKFSVPGVQDEQKKKR